MYHRFEENKYPSTNIKINDFIEHLKSYNDIKLEVFPTSTVIYGDFDNVMEVLSSSIKWNVNNKNKAVFVTKFLPNYEAI